jgi:hypothetical protein
LSRISPGVKAAGTNDQGGMSDIEIIEAVAANVRESRKAAGL